MKLTVRVAAAALVLAGLAHAQEARPKNVILMIGDGMGFNHVETGSIYQYGERRAQPYWAFTHFGCTTYPENNREGYKPEEAYKSFKWFLKLPTDSAASATTMASGQKVPNGYIGMNRAGEKLRSLVEEAHDLGKMTGVLSTVRINHATPASFLAHNRTRQADLEIARESILESKADLIMGPGHPWYDTDSKQVGGLDPDPMLTPLTYDHVGGPDTWQALRAGTAGADTNGDGTADPWTLIDTTDGILALKSGDTPARVLAMVPVHTTLQQERSGDENAAPFDVPLTANLPTMSDMMLAALNVLDDDPDGFFLMGEGGAIDWASHDNQLGRMIEEQIDFDRAIADVAAWIEKNSSWDDTLLIITADHECGYLVGPGSDPEWKEIVNNGKGVLPGGEWKSTGHTNQLVPLFAKGAGAAKFADYVDGTDPVHGPYVDHSDIPALVRANWR